MEKKARKLVSAAEKQAGDKRITENYAALKALSESEEVKRLMASADVGSVVGANGTAADTAERLKKLLSTPEGKKLVRMVADITEKGRG